MRFGRKYAMVHLRAPYLEVDMDDMRSDDRFSGILGRVGDAQLHVASTRSPIQYLVGPKTLTRHLEMRGAILNRIQTKWANTANRLGPREIYAPTLNQEIAIR